MKRLLPAFILGFALLAGCAATPPSRAAAWTAPDFWQRGIHRIVVVPFDSADSAREESRLLTEAFGVELQKAHGFDLITASARDVRLAAEGDLWRRGAVDAAALIGARERYRADAFLFGSVTQYKPYDPPLVGAKVRLICARTADVLWSGDGLYDASDRAVRRAALRYFEQSGLKGSLYGETLILMSPRLFSKYVAADMAAALRRPELGR